MAEIHGLDIVRSGLVLFLDAGNPQSFNGNSTTWYDLSGNGNHGTLVNGPTYTGSTKGGIVFDGINDYTSITNNNMTFTNKITVDIWIKPNTNNIINPYLANYIIGRELSYRILCGPDGFTWVCATSNNSWYTNGTYVSTPSGLTVNYIWVNIIGVYDGIKNYIYVNGVLMGYGSNISGNIFNSPNALGLMNSLASNVAYGKGVLGIAKIYNRALSPDEILQNFNATRNRYEI